MVAAAAPLIISTDLINKYFKRFIPQNYCRILAALVYGSYTFIGANILQIFLILLVSCCHIFDKQVEQNLRFTKGVPSKNKTIEAHKYLLRWAKYFIKLLSAFCPI